MTGEEEVPKQLKQYGAQYRTICLSGVNFSLYLSYVKYFISLNHISLSLHAFLS